MRIEMSSPLAVYAWPVLLSVLNITVGYMATVQSVSVPHDVVFPLYALSIALDWTL